MIGNVPGIVCCGSWLCQNALAEALRRGDFEEVAAFDHFAVFGAFSFLKRSVAKAELPWARLQGTNDVCRLCPRRRQEWLDTHDVHNAREVVGQHVQRHLGGNPWQPLHQEVCRSHPRLDRAERMLDGLAPLAHLLRMLVQPALHRFNNVLMLAADDPSLLAGGAAALDGAALAGVGPVQDQSTFLVRVAVGEPFTGRTNVSVLFSPVAEVLLSEASCRLLSSTSSALAA